MVDDCCPRDSGAKCREVAARDPRVKVIELARNFGQHIAISAGLDYAEGDYVFVMDCDLQDVPEEISVLFEKAQEGYDTVCAQRVLRRDGFLKRMSSKLFYKIFNFLTYLV